MWEAAAKKMKAMGGRILMDHALERLTYDEARALWTIEVMRGDGTRERLVANEIVSSAPIRELMSALKPTPLSLLHARELRYRDFLTVVLIGRCERDLPDNWIYIHDETVKVGRVQNFRSWSPDMIPDGVSTCLGLEYFCFEGDNLWNADDADLIGLAKKEIAQIGLIDAEDMIDACVVRQPKAYPVYDDAYRDNVAMIRDEIAQRFPNLHLVGRNGMHKYNNQDHAMMTAMLTARNILEGARTYDVWEVNEDAQYHETGASGVQKALGSERLVPQRVKAAANG
jgi:protoporphyrinogen oxidase